MGVGSMAKWLMKWDIPKSLQVAEFPLVKASIIAKERKKQQTADITVDLPRNIILKQQKHQPHKDHSHSYTKHGVPIHLGFSFTDRIRAVELSILNGHRGTQLCIPPLSILQCSTQVSDICRCGLEESVVARLGPLRCCYSSVKVGSQGAA